MKINYKILIAVFTAASVVACVKAPHGFLSSQIRYRDSPIQVQRGNVVQTSAVDNDGSSAPVTYKLLDIRDAVTHKHADSIYANRPRYVYISQFDPNVDTTVALLNSTRKLVNSPTFDFNVHTGGFTFYGTTATAPAGKYEFDISATNENGTKTFKNVAYFNLFDGDVAEIDAGGSAWFQDNSTANGDTGNPPVTVQKLSNNGTLAILKIVDEHGTPFNPKNGEYITRGDRSDFTTFAKFHPVIVSDTSLTCNFEVIPFPFQGAAQGFTIYYRIPSKFAKFDAGYTPTSARIYSANPRFTVRVFQAGTYLITVTVPHVTRDPI
ncbi:MAG: hypothetical protein JWR50_1124 [Mucilaginibacter sp.]|nr:hypothetical protein [Mucilaginibacter sp.]